MTSGSLCYYYRKKVNVDVHENNATGHYRTSNSNAMANISFEYEPKIIRNTPDDKNTLVTEVVVPMLFE